MNEKERKAIESWYADRPEQMRRALREIEIEEKALALLEQCKDLRPSYSELEEIARCFLEAAARASLYK